VSQKFAEKSSDRFEEFIGSFGADKQVGIFAGEVIPGDPPV
jgi:hypothetical protein